VSELPLPVPNADTEPFWDACRAGELRLQRCADCAEWRYPPQPACGACGSLAAAWVPVSGRGTVFSYAVTHQPIHPALSGRTPFASVVVELDEGPLLTSNLVDVDPDDIVIGMPVDVVFEQAGDMVLPKFRKRQPAG
jgi:uncharacterized OB-fold protein